MADGIECKPLVIATMHINCFDRQVVLTDKVGTICNTIVAECPTEVIIEGESIYKSMLGALKNTVKIKII